MYIILIMFVQYHTSFCIHIYSNNMHFKVLKDTCACMTAVDDVKRVCGKERRER